MTDLTVGRGCVVGSNPGALEGFDSGSDQDAIHGSNSFSHLGLWQSLDSSQGIYHLSDLERGTEVAEHVAPERLTPVEGKTQPEWRERLESQPSTALHQPVEPLQTVEPYLTTVEAKKEYESKQTVEPQQQVESTESHLMIDPKETVEPPQTVELATESTRTMEPTEKLEPEEQTVGPLAPPLVNASSETDFPELWTADGDPEEGSLTNESSTDYSDRIYDEYDTRNPGIDGDEEADENGKWNTDGIYRGGPPVENKKATNVPRSVQLAV